MEMNLITSRAGPQGQESLAAWNDPIPVLRITHVMMKIRGVYANIGWFKFNNLVDPWYHGSC